MTTTPSDHTPDPVTPEERAALKEQVRICVMLQKLHGDSWIEEWAEVADRDAFNRIYRRISNAAWGDLMDGINREIVAEFKQARGEKP